MHWRVPEEWQNVLRLTAVAQSDRTASTMRVRDAFNEAGAFITDVHLFSGLQTTLTFEVAPERLPALVRALDAAGLSFDDASRRALAQATDGEIHGTLAIMFAHGDPDLKHEVPAVPG